jgi:hypothetical protein
MNTVFANTATTIASRSAWRIASVTDASLGIGGETAVVLL